jgi:hypothetical protein
MSAVSFFPIGSDGPQPMGDIEINRHRPTRGCKNNESWNWHRREWSNIIVIVAQIGVAAQVERNSSSAEEGTSWIFGD